MLTGIDLSVGPGEVHGIVGPSGSGKTTLLNVIAGLEDLDAGSVTLSGVTLTDADVLIERDRRNVLLAAQEAVLDRDHNVAANIAAGLPKGKRRSREGAHRVAMLMDLLELPTPVADSRPHQLSVAQRQRVALARAVAGFGVGGAEAAVLLDEPLSAIEVGARVRLLRAVLDDVGSQPIPILLVSHDPVEVAAVAGRQSGLVGGRLTPG